MTLVTLTLAGQNLAIECADCGIGLNRTLDAADFQRAGQWATTYAAALRRKDDQRDLLLTLGREMRDWLDSGAKWLAAVLEHVANEGPPLLFEFAATERDSDNVRRFLNAPWELLADERGHWAGRESLAFCPLRRLGRRTTPTPASLHKLTAVFMAASPENQSRLRFEHEEAAILKATRETGMDMVVEDSGTLALLASRLRDETPEVVHLSCHGTLNPQPALALEDEFGEEKRATVAELRDELGEHRPRFLFLSACQTAAADVVDSLAWELVPRVAHALLGWAGSVDDGEATDFAHHLYRRLAQGVALENAVAKARCALMNPSPGQPSAPSRDWHLARLFLGPQGGGVLATGRNGWRRAPREQAYQAFLGLEKDVPVAGPFEFVGRRRHLQSILREFLHPQPDEARKAGLVVQGLGQQGKSSLAARVAQRMEGHGYKVVVVFGKEDAHYGAESILNAFVKYDGSPTVKKLVDEHLPGVRANASDLRAALKELLEKPFGYATGDAEDPTSQPVLLVIDDFEKALEGETGAGLYRVRRELAPSLCALVTAFQHDNTPSRLLFTSRFAFALHEASGGADLFPSLRLLELPPLPPQESAMQAHAKLREAAPPAAARQAAEKRLPTIIEVGGGHAGLQSRLFTLACEDPAACDLCVQQAHDYRASGAWPDQQQLVDLLLKLALQETLALLSDNQRELLRFSMLFEVPVPASLMRTLAIGAARDVSDDDLARITGLGLWDVYPDAFQRNRRAVALNPLVQPLAGQLTPNETQFLGALAARPLFDLWGGAAGDSKRTRLDEYQLAKLALFAGDAEILQLSTAYAVSFLENQNNYRAAAALGEGAIEIIVAAGLIAPLHLRLFTARSDVTLGEVGKARAHLNGALEEIALLQKQGQSVKPEDHAAVLLAHGRLLVRDGEPDAALLEFERARGLLTGEREKAVLLGDIARLRAQKGEVDEALQLHQQRLKVYEGLGDTRSRAMTLGDIARLRANKGEVDEALALNQEMLLIFEALDDKRSYAVTLGEIANLHAGKGEVDAALKLHEEELATYNGLGDIDSTAATLWEIAQIELGQQKIQEAFDHLAQSYAINLKLGRLDGICIVGLIYGQLLFAAGQRDEGVAIVERSREGFLKMGWADLANQAQSLLDRMRSL